MILLALGLAGVLVCEGGEGSTIVFTSCLIVPCHLLLPSVAAICCCHLLLLSTTIRAIRVTRQVLVLFILQLACLCGDCVVVYILFTRTHYFQVIAVLRIAPRCVS